EHGGPATDVWMGHDPLEETPEICLQAPKADLPSHTSRQEEVSTQASETFDEFPCSQIFGRAAGGPGQLRKKDSRSRWREVFDQTPEIADGPKPENRRLRQTCPPRVDR